MRPSCPSPRWAGLQGFCGTEPPELHEATPDILSWASAPRQSTPEQRAAAKVELGESEMAAPPLRFVPLQRIPAQDCGFVDASLPHLHRLTPSGFRNLMARLLFLCLLTTISGQIRSWGSPYRALLLPRSRALSPAPIPSCRWEDAAPATQPRNRKRRHGEQATVQAPTLAFRVLLHVRVRH